VVFGRGWDKEGSFVRRYVPELKGLGEKWIYEPWKAPKAELKKAGVRIEGDGMGEREEGTYPEPMFDFAERRGVCIEGMKKAYKVGLYGDDPRVLDGSWKGLFEDGEAEKVDDKKGSADGKGKRKRGQSTLDGHVKKTKT